MNEVVQERIPLVQPLSSLRGQFNVLKAESFFSMGFERFFIVVERDLATLKVIELTADNLQRLTVGNKPEISVLSWTDFMESRLGINLYSNDRNWEKLAGPDLLREIAEEYGA